MRHITGHIRRHITWHFSDHQDPRGGERDTTNLRATQQ